MLVSCLIFRPIPRQARQSACTLCPAGYYGSERWGVLTQLDPWRCAVGSLLTWLNCLESSLACWTWPEFSYLHRPETKITTCFFDKKPIPVTNSSYAKHLQVLISRPFVCCDLCKPLLLHTLLELYRVVYPSTHPLTSPPLSIASHCQFFPQRPQCGRNQQLNVHHLPRWPCITFRWPCWPQQLRILRCWEVPMTKLLLILALWR